MKNEILVSVIIPTYKNRGLLCQAIDTALAQDYQNVEVVVVDDNSPDSEARQNTESQMLKYETDPRVRYIKHEFNKNGAAARNTGIKASKGDLIAFLDDDDEFLPGKLTAQVSFLQSHKEYQAVYNLATVNGLPVKTLPYEGDATIPLLKNQTRMFTPSLMFWKYTLLEIGGFDESFRRHQDYELLIKFFAKGYKIGCIQKIYTNVNDIGGNRIVGKDLENLKCSYLKTFDNVLNRLEQKEPGIKKSIIVNNYASVFISHLASHEYRRAMAIFFRYGILNPGAFLSHIVFFIKMHGIK